MAEIIGYDKFGDPKYDISGLTPIEHGGDQKMKVYRLDNGTYVDEDGIPLALLDLYSLELVDENDDEEAEVSLGLTNEEIEQRLQSETDETEIEILKFRRECNHCIEDGETGSIIEPLFGCLSRVGKRYAEKIGEDNVRRCLDEQQALYDRTFPSEEFVQQELGDLFGEGYSCYVEQYGSNYMVHFEDELFGGQANIMLNKGKVYYTNAGDGEKQDPDVADLLKARGYSIKELFGVVDDSYERFKAEAENAFHLMLLANEVYKTIKAGSSDRKELNDWCLKIAKVVVHGEESKEFDFAALVDCYRYCDNQIRKSIVDSAFHLEEGWRKIIRHYDEVVNMARRALAI